MSFSQLEWLRRKIFDRIQQNTNDVNTRNDYDNDLTRDEIINWINANVVGRMNVINNEFRDTINSGAIQTTPSFPTYTGRITGEINSRQTITYNGRGLLYLANHDGYGSTPWSEVVVDDQYFAAGPMTYKAACGPIPFKRFVTITGTNGTPPLYYSILFT